MIIFQLNFNKICLSFRDYYLIDSVKQSKIKMLSLGFFHFSFLNKTASHHYFDLLNIGLSAISNDMELFKDSLSVDILNVDKVKEEIAKNLRKEFKEEMEYLAKENYDLTNKLNLLLEDNAELEKIIIRQDVTFSKPM